MSLVIWIFVYSLLLLALRACLGKASESRVLKLFFFPGFVAAVFVRSVACFASRAPIRVVNLPWREGAPIVRGRPAVPLCGSLLFALLPIASGAALLLAVASVLGYPLRFDVTLPAIGPEMRSLSLLAGTSAEIFRAAVRTLETLDPGDGRLWLFIYAAAAVHLYLAPQIDEWPPLAILLGVSGLVFAAASWIGLRTGFLSRAWFIGHFYGDAVWGSLSLLVATALLGLAVAALAGAGFALGRAVLSGRKAGK